MYLRFASAVIAIIAVGLMIDPAKGRNDPLAPRIALSNALGSPDELAAAFVAALSANDRAAIERLRINEQEYLTLILPGSVKPGSPPQVMPRRKSEYFWSHNNSLNLYSLDALMRSSGGRQLRLERLELPQADRRAWYVVHRDPILHLVQADGSQVELQLGSVAEHGGRFKFISYRAD
jgi:hypothetical protein